jgi:hypothetical protein
MNDKTRQPDPAESEKEMQHMHDGKCNPFTVDLPHGPDTNPEAWAMSKHALHGVHNPLLGWRIEPVYFWQDSAAIGRYEPSDPYNHLFTPGSLVDGPAGCYPDTEGRRRSPVSPIKGWHDSPETYCSCGLRVIENLRATSRYLKLNMPDLESRPLPPGPQGMQVAWVIAAVVGLGRTARGTSDDPGCCLRTEYVSIQGTVLFDKGDSQAASRFDEEGGWKSLLIDDLQHAHEADHCSALYRGPQQTK